MELKIIAKLNEKYGTDYQEILDNLDDDINDIVEELLIEELTEKYENVISDIQDTMSYGETFNIGDSLEDIYFVKDGIAINNQYGDDVFWNSSEDFAECNSDKETVVMLLDGNIQVVNDCIDYIDNCYNGETTEAICNKYDFDDFKEINDNLEKKVGDLIDENIAFVRSYFLDNLLKDSEGKKKTRTKI